MASQLTIATIFLLLVAQITQIQAPIPLAGLISAGTSLAGTTIQALSLHLDYRVTMGMEVENWTKFTLLDPHVTRKSGVITMPPVPVRPGEKEGMMARKTGWTATGTRGAVSWEIVGKYRRLVIMWDVPYDQNYHSNWLAIGITTDYVEHYWGWADQMDQNNYRGWYLRFKKQEYDNNVYTLTYEDSELGLVVYATMSTAHKALVNVIFSARSEGDLAKPIRDSLDPNKKK